MTKYSHIDNSGQISEVCCNLNHHHVQATSFSSHLNHVHLIKPHSHRPGRLSPHSGHRWSRSHSTCSASGHLTTFWPASHRSLWGWQHWLHLREQGKEKILLKHLIWRIWLEIFYISISVNKAHGKSKPNKVSGRLSVHSDFPTLCGVTIICHHLKIIKG